MSPEQMAALGLTYDPTETGVIMDVYCFPDHPPVYLTAGEWRAVKRRMRQRERHREQAADSSEVSGHRAIRGITWRHLNDD